MSWTVERVGYAPIKGTRHLARPSVALSPTGPVGDRRFCLVDPEHGRALRTVENPGLVAVRAQCSGSELSCRFRDDSPITATITVTEDESTFDYWGRQVTGRIVRGPWAAAFGRYLDADPVLVACDPGDVVFGAPVTVVCRSSIDALAEQLGTPIDPARWRATVVIDDSTGPIEAGWIGRRLRIGAATLSVTAPVARCAVINVSPETGRRDGALLKALDRTAGRDETFGDPVFGVQATIARPGLIQVGDRAELLS